MKHLEQLIKEEGERHWKPPEGEDSCVLGSANQLFLKIRASLTRCVKLISRGTTLVRLTGAFKVGRRGRWQQCQHWPRWWLRLVLSRRECQLPWASMLTGETKKWRFTCA